ncbi:hypothetical protein ACQPZX_17305 [Actinoplanes sp. CA-142083]|uniref:hypothetical protein n=1 Tax=Actinoplanes sp. CA-142083 TaxID=3239903 RepID=UPI003D8EABF2
MPGAAAKAYHILAAILIVASYESFLLALPHHQAWILSNVMVALFTAVGALACGWFAAKARGPERRWRLFAAVSLGAESAGQGVWTDYLIAAPAKAATLSWPDLAFLVSFAAAITGVVLAARRASASPAQASAGRARMLQDLRLVLDGALVLGSLFLLAWMTVLRPLAGRGPDGQASTAAAFWCPAADVMLIALVLLIYATRRVPRRNVGHLALIAGGVITTALSDIAFSYYLSGSVAQYPVVADIGYLVGPLLIARAAAMQDFASARSAAHQVPQTTVRPAAAPYVPLLLLIAFLTGKNLSGATLTTFETIGAAAIFTLFALRQATAWLSNSPVPVGDSREPVLSVAAASATSAEGDLPAHVLYLRDEHRRQIEQLRHSGNRVAWWSFVASVLFGLLCNIIVALVLG